MKAEDILKQLEPAIQEKLTSAAKTLEDNGEALVQYEFLVETSAGAPYVSGMEYLSQWVHAKANITSNQDNKLSMKLDFAPNHSLHPGLDTLLGIVMENVKAKFGYERKF